MEAAARNLKFEVAQRYKTRLDALDNYSSKSVIVSARIVNVDVFSLLVDDDVAYCNFLRIRHGSVVGVYTIRLTTGIDTDPAQMLTLAIQHIAETIAGTLAKEVIVPYLPSAAQLFDGVTFTVPKRGENSICWSSRSRAPVSIAPNNSRTSRSRIPSGIPNA